MYVDVGEMDEDGCKSLMLSLSLTGCFMVFHLADSVQQLANQIGRRGMKEPGRLYIKGLAAKTEFGSALHSALNLFWPAEIGTISDGNVQYS